MSKKIVNAVIIVTALSLSACATNKTQVTENKTFKIQQWQTKNGARVLYVHAPGLPMVDIQAVFDAGSVRNGDKPGLASLTNSLLSHGAKMGKRKLSVDEISERFETIGARFSTGTSKDNAEISLRTLTDEKWLSKAVATMQSVLTAPTFDTKELNRIRKQRLISLESRKQSPGTIASEIFYKTLFASHPYATPGIGTKQSLKKITRKDLVSFYKKYYVAKNALVTIVGDVSRQKAEQLAEQVVGRLPAGNKASRLAEVSPFKQKKMIHREFPSSQTHILMGQTGIHRKDKDYFTLYVANHILGGSGFGSRIMQEIREKRGLAYSSYSYFAPMLKNGPFIIGMQTQNEKTTEALKVLRKTLSEFIKNGPTEEELKHSKMNITGGFPMRIDSNSDISNYLAVIGFYNLPLTYLDDFNKKIQAVTLAQIKEALKRRINPEQLLTVTVGQNKS